MVIGWGDRVHPGLLPAPRPRPAPIAVRLGERV